jgi:hypothetical protein
VAIAFQFHFGKAFRKVTLFGKSQDFALFLTVYEFDSISVNKKFPISLTGLHSLISLEVDWKDMDGEDLPNSVARQAKARTRKHCHYLKTPCPAFLANLKRALGSQELGLPSHCKALACLPRQFAEDLGGEPRAVPPFGMAPGRPGLASSVRAHGHTPLRVNSCSPGSHGFPVPASTSRAKPRCDLKSTDTKITSLSPRKIRSTYYQGLSEPKITGPVGSMPSITCGINKMSLFLRNHAGRFSGRP